MQRIVFFISVVCIASLELSGCTTSPPFVPEATAENTTEEGLVRVENTRFDEVYVWPGFDLTDFDTVILAPVSVSYKNSRPENELNDRQLDLMKRYFGEELAAVFSEGGQYELTGTAGATTMRVHAGISDLEINVPTDLPAIHRNVVFVASSGQMTLVADIYNAHTKELLARIKDRRQAQQQWHKATSVFEWSEVRRAFNYWARIARDRIDSVYASKF